MRRFVLSFFILITSYSLSAQNASDVELRDLSGNYTTIHENKGDKLTVLDFWATWCKPCVKSIPKLIVLSDKYQNEGVAFIGINEDSPRNIAKVRPFASSLGIDYPVLLDTDQEVMSSLLVNIFPTLIILDNEGEILYTHEGYTPGDEILIDEKIQALLADEE